MLSYKDSYLAKSTCFFMAEPIKSTIFYIAAELVFLFA